MPLGRLFPFAAASDHDESSMSRNSTSFPAYVVESYILSLSSADETVRPESPERSNFNSPSRVKSEKPDESRDTVMYSSLPRTELL